MSGFFSWFLVIVGVLVIFNAEKLPALRRILEEKFKDSVDLAKESSKTIKNKVDKVKSDIDNRKNSARQPDEPEENSDEEIEEALNFMTSYVNPENKETGEQSGKIENSEKSASDEAETVQTPPTEEKWSLESAFAENSAAEQKDDKPVNLDHHY